MTSPRHWLGVIGLLLLGGYWCFPSIAQAPTPAPAYRIPPPGHVCSDAETTTTAPLCIDGSVADGDLATALANGAGGYSGSGSTGTPSWNTVMAVGNTYSGAVSAPTAVIITRGTGTPGQALWTDTNGNPRHDCFEADGTTACVWNVTTHPSKPFHVYAEAGDDLLSVDEDTSTISLNVTTTLATGAQLVLSSSGLKSAAADPADSGVIRLGNAETICWESSPAGTDNCLSVNSSEALTYNGSAIGGTIGGTVAALQIPYASGTDTLAGTDNLTWTNASTRLGIQGTLRNTNGSGRTVDTSFVSADLVHLATGSGTGELWQNASGRNWLTHDPANNRVDIGNTTDNYELRLRNAGNLTMGAGSFLVNTNKFTVDGSNGNTVVAGTLTQTGVATFTAAPVFSAPPTYQTTLPVRSIYVPADAMTVSGTCTDTDPVVRTPVASGPKRATIELADDDTCSIEFDFVMPDSWNAGTLTVELAMLSTGNNNNERVEMHFAGQCVRSGDQLAAHSTTGEQAATITFGNSTNYEGHATTSAITLNGTCAAGAHVYMRGQVNANTGGTPTNLSPMTDGHVLGAKVEYSITTSTDN